MTKHAPHDAGQWLIPELDFEKENQKKSDRLMNYFMSSFFVFGLVFAFFYDTWLLALGVGGLCVLAFYSVKFLLPESNLYQYVLSVVLGIFMAQYIYQMHGMFEMHFFAFIGSAILIIYQNWKLQIPMFIFVVFHHALLGYMQNIGFDKVYFTQLDYFQLQTFFIHILLAAAIFFICGLWAYRMNRLGKQQIEQVIKMEKLREDAALYEERIKNQEVLKLAFEKAELARRDAERANNAKSVFLATMSHEIRTPMNGVMGMAALLAETNLNEEQRGYAETIITCSDSLLTIINDILDFSKIESGKMDLVQQDFNLRSCIEDVLDVFAGKTSEVGLDLVYQIDYNVPAQIIGDQLRLRQILMNLVGNAVKFTEKGEIVVDVRLSKLLPDNKAEICFEVRDSGIGIAPEKLGMLFKAFSQVDSSTTRKYGGTGLGLVICEKLVKLMDGDIKVKSTLGAGTTFSFTIQVSNSTLPIRTYVNNSMVGHEGKRVLVIDDNNTNRTILKKQLQQWKLDVVVAHSGYEALNILASSQPFNLVLTDMEMPGMDGVEVTQKIVKQYPQLPVIVLSSVGDTLCRQHAELFAGIVNKPVKQQILCTYILEALRTQVKQPAAGNTPGKTALSVNFSRLHPLRILVAEDEPVNQKLASHIFKKSGYQIDIAKNGRVAIAMAQEKTYDVIFMDIQMPEMDGLTASRHITAHFETKPIIIAMTANAMQGDREMCLAAGMDDYIAKPISFKELLSKLEKWSAHVRNEPSQHAALTL